MPTRSKNEPTGKSATPSPESSAERAARERRKFLEEAIEELRSWHKAGLIQLAEGNEIRDLPKPN
jgi:hypothetical protein